MIYEQKEEIQIRDLRYSDAQIITDEERAQGWNAEIDKYLLRLRDQREGRSINLVAEYHGQVAGYINIYPNAQGGAFAAGRLHGRAGAG